MGKHKASDSSSDRRKWQKILSALVLKLQTQQIQVESLVKERKILEDRIKIQYDRWISDVGLFKDEIFEMKRDFTAKEMELFVEAARAELVVGSKEREATFYMRKLEDTDSELTDFKLGFDILSKQIPEPRETNIEKEGGEDLKSTKISKEGEEALHKALEREIRKLKREYEKLSSKSNSDVSALLSEKEFAWNQYNKMENDYSIQLKVKDIEVQKAKARIEELEASVEELSSSSNEKDDTIVMLRTSLATEEANTIKVNAEISRLNREIEMLRKSKGSSSTPLLYRCGTGSGNSRSKKSEGGDNRQRALVKVESPRSQVLARVKDHGKGSGSRSSKRKGSDSETPKLFSSRFRVPKLKNLSHDQ